MIDSTASVVEDRTKANVEVEGAEAVLVERLMREAEKEVSGEKDERVKACHN